MIKLSELVFTLGLLIFLFLVIIIEKDLIIFDFIFTLCSLDLSLLLDLKFLMFF
jgi:hypothetical protein